MAFHYYPVPKKEIKKLIIQNFSSIQIRTILNIKIGTDIENRLMGFSKSKLLNLLQSTEGGRIALEKAKANYPLSSNPTLYMISVSYWPDWQDIQKKTEIFTNQMRKERLSLGDDRTIRAIYMMDKAKEYKNKLIVQEIPLVYEKKIEYINSDPDPEAFGEVITDYGLEHAFIWYCTKYKHALLLCSEYQAVKPIIKYGIEKLGIKWHLPNLSESMLHRLAEGANPRTASFARLEEKAGDNFDIQTMTISDQELSVSKYFQQLMNDSSRQQTFGYYSNHPALYYGGIGISRRYGRIWTPVRLDKNALLKLAFILIQKTEEELKNESNINLRGYITYDDDHEVHIGGRSIKSNNRKLFNILVEAIINAQRKPNMEVELAPDVINDLIGNSDILNVFPALEINCANCGSYLLKCSECQYPLISQVDKHSLIVFSCPLHKDIKIFDDQTLRCNCGTEVDITFSSDIRIFPGAELLKAIYEFLSLHDFLSFDGSFKIIGNTIVLIPKHKGVVERYHLADFQLWKSTAKLHQRYISSSKQEEYRRLLFRIKEKCSRDDRHPRKATCQACLEEKITYGRIQAGKEICLPRLIGLPIGKGFEGIHHRYETADIKYTDLLFIANQEYSIWIHLKSRVKTKSEKLGRSAASIKGLYTQYCYSAYLASHQEKNRIIGISIPNGISEEVIENIEYLSQRLGFPSIILDEDDWVKILAASLEFAYVENK